MHIRHPVIRVVLSVALIVSVVMVWTAAQGPVMSPLGPIRSVGGGGSSAPSDLTTPVTSSADPFQLRVNGAVALTVGNVGGAVGFGDGQTFFLNGAGSTILFRDTTPSAYRGLHAGDYRFGSTALDMGSPGASKFYLYDQTRAIRTFLFAPTIVSGFGTSPSIGAGSSSTRGTVNVGTGGVATSGVISFGGTWDSAPSCIVQDTTTLLVQRATATTTQMTITSAAWTASDVLAWLCYGGA